MALPYLQRSGLFRLQGDLDKAAEQLTKVLEISPDNVDTLLLRASIYYQQDKPELALADVEQAIRLQPQRLQSHLMRAEIYAATDRMQQAIGQLEQLLRLAPGQKELMVQLSSFYQIDERPRKSIEMLTQALSQDPDDARALRLRGDAYLSIGQHAQAVADFEHALKQEGGEEDDGLLNNLAWVLATSPIDEVRNGGESLKLATQAAELTAYQSPTVLSTLAAAYAESGDMDNAIKWSEKAVELSQQEVDQAEDDAERARLQDVHADLEKELASYHAGKPVRELREEQEKQLEPPPAGDHGLAPAGPAAAARTLDF